MVRLEVDVGYNLGSWDLRWIRRSYKNPKQVQEAEAGLGYIGRSCLRNKNKITIINR